MVEHAHGHLGARVAAALGDELLPRHVEPQLAWLGLGLRLRVRVRLRLRLRLRVRLRVRLYLLR